MTHFRTVVLLSALGLAAIGCRSDTPTTNRAAGANEKSFAERYDPTMTLPMPEALFRGKLDRLGLDYEVQDERGSVQVIEPPRWSTALDLSTIKRCYKIYGTTDNVKRVCEVYRAFVDAKDRVVYIENNFQYTGP